VYAITVPSMCAVWLYAVCHTGIFLAIIFSEVHNHQVAWWRNGEDVGLAINRSRIQILLRAMLRNNLGQVVQTYVPVTKQYNLVLAKGR